MLTAVLALSFILQAPAPSTETAQIDLAVISARLGPCAADFTVVDAGRTPIYAATVHVRIRYGFLALKRMDLEVGTNSDGKARVEGLPSNARPLVYEVSKGESRNTVEQNLYTNCQATYDVSLP